MPLNLLHSPAVADSQIMEVRERIEEADAQELKAMKSEVRSVVCHIAYSVE